MFKGPLPAEVNYRKLVGDRTKLDGTIPVSSFHRLVESISNDKGEVQARLEFRRGKKQKTLIIGHVIADLELICQNCLEPFSFQIVSSFRWFLVKDEDALIDLEADDEGVICGEDRINIVELLEDEILVSLPMVAKHPEGACSFVAQHVGDALDNKVVNDISVRENVPEETSTEVKSDTYQPFASLAELKNQFDRS